MSVRRQVPRITDPGGDGWPLSPKVSAAEIALYAEMAETVRLLGTAATAAADAYSLACRASADGLGATQASQDYVDEVIWMTYDTQVLVRKALRDVAERALAWSRQYSRPPGVSVDQTSAKRPPSAA